jgi:Ser/Thr protein kinase RdoA (MazF antagonist)
MSRTTTGNPQDLFFQLTPDLVMDAVENCGWLTTGEYLQLNSYENRVFSVKTEDPVGGAAAVGAAVPQIIVKFYRPGRWSEAAIREEHAFLNELSAQGVAVVPPLKQKNGDTLSLQHGLWFAAFPKFRGRMPQELGFEELTRLGRVLARLHNTGALSKAKHRAIIDAENFGRPALETVRPLMNRDIWARYEEAAEGILDYLDSELDPRGFQRIHGDAHRGNVLMTDEAGKSPEFFLIDFDDFATGPVVQDFWMLFRHDEDDFAEELGAFLDGYTELREFDESTLRLMEPLRGLRILHYAAWIARRWNDPSFPKIFPNFGTDAYWFEEMQALEKVLHKLN